MTTTTAPVTAPDDIQDGDDTPPDCVVCCQDDITFCGKYLPGPVTSYLDDLTDEQLCPDCLTQRCQICGCGVYDTCATCTTCE
jgi:hypothetical protein